MKPYFAFFAAWRYWTDAEKLQNAYRILQKQLDCAENSALVTGPEQLGALPQADCLVAVPMSGAVQRNIMDASERYPTVLVYAAYVRGNAPEELTDEMLRCNAAPTVMDVWAVLRREHGCARLALNGKELTRCLRLFDAYRYVRGAKLLQIGDTEPWVISNSRDRTSYERRLGVTVEPVAQSELAERYRATADEQAQPYYEHFRANAQRMEEPTEQDLRNAARMACALHGLLRDHNAQGAALACFHLLGEGTTACLGVSYINDCTGQIASCEGDLDSAVTMLLLKRLTGGHLWMANPALQPDGTVNFSHCTAPLCVCGAENRPCVLRSHHESGIGVSLQVEMPLGCAVTACRISNEAGSITVHRGVSIPGPYECACRTQMHVQLEDADHYLHTALGCHQVFAFEDIADDVRALAELFGLRLL